MGDYLIRPAGPDDLAAILALRTEAERWLAHNGIRQWTADYDQYARGVLTRWVRSGNAWVVDHQDQTVATVSVMLRVPDPDFWGWADPADQVDALYIGKMIVSRALAGRGLGDAIMNWASLRAARAEVNWLRLDVRRDNTRLQEYYLDRLFIHVRTWHEPRRRTESGWLAQRPAGSTTTTPIRLVQDGDAVNQCATACPGGSGAPPGRTVRG